MITEDFYTGRIVVDNDKNTYLILPTKKSDGKYRLYLHNLTENEFVSTLFITYMDEKRSIFRFNRFDLGSKLKRFYVILWNNLTDMYEVLEENTEKLTETFVYMEEERKKQKKYIRRYKEL